MVAQFLPRDWIGMSSFGLQNIARIPIRAVRESAYLNRAKRRLPGSSSAERRRPGSGVLGLLSHNGECCHFEHFLSVHKIDRI
jgi:hypothetical protein